MTDKESEAWKNEFWYIRLFSFGIKTRSRLVAYEYFLVTIGVLSWVLSTGIEITTPLAFFFAYTNAKLIAYLDNKAYW